MSTFSTFTAAFLGSLAAHAVWSGSKHAIQFINANFDSVLIYGTDVPDGEKITEVNLEDSNLSFSSAKESRANDVAYATTVPSTDGATPVLPPAPRATTSSPTKAALVEESNFNSDAETKVNSPLSIPGYEPEPQEELTKAKKKRNKNKKKSKPSKVVEDQKETISGTDFAALDEVQCP